MLALHLKQLCTHWKNNTVIYMFTQGIIDSTGTETRQIFSRMFVMAKSVKELFTPT